MIEVNKKSNKWLNRRVGITGASGSLGSSLTKMFQSKGASVIGFTHSKIKSSNTGEEWVHWDCGKEEKLTDILSSLDILILNHGVNPKGSSSSTDLNKALEVNAFSVWRIIEIFEKVAQNKSSKSPKEIWVNTSEAEIMPALSPGYEISKRLIGQLTSLKASKLTNKSNLIIRKLILGPFRSSLNPIGIMSSDFVADQVINQAGLNFKLIIVTPNPLTFLFIPINELIRYAYFKILQR